MTPGGAKSKGKSFEQLVADLLHKYFMEYHKEYRELFNSVGNNDLKPQRDSSSGNFDRSDGDIELNLLKKYFPFSIECKHHKDLDLTLNSMLKKGSKKLTKIFEEQATVNADRKNLNPIIVFKANRTEIFVYAEKKVLTVLPKKYIVIENKVICLFKDFIDEYLRGI